MKNKHWFSLTKRCLTLADEWTISGEILNFFLAREASLCFEPIAAIASTPLLANVYNAHLGQGAGEQPADMPEPRNRKEFQDFRGKFDSNWELAAYLYRDRQGSVVGCHRRVQV